MPQTLHNDLPISAKEIFKHLVATYDIKENATRHSQMPSEEYLVAEKTARITHETADTLPKHDRPSLAELKKTAEEVYQVGLAAGKMLARAEPAIEQYAQARLTGNDDGLVAFKANNFSSRDGTKSLGGAQMMKEAGLSVGYFAPGSASHGSLADRISPKDGGKGRGSFKRGA